MKNRVGSIKHKVLKFIRLIREKFNRICSIVSRPFSKAFGALIIRLPHKYRVRIYNLEKHFKNPKVKSAAAIIVLLIVTIPLVIFQFKLNNHGNLPWNEEIAEGAWILHNREPIRGLVGGTKLVDLNLEEVENEEAKAKSELQGDHFIDQNKIKYRWHVINGNGTKFEFGEVSSSIPEGKVMPVVKITDKDGWFVRYAPKSEIRNSKSLPAGRQGETNSEIINPKSSIVNQFVIPKVKGNVIEWEIADGITARYTMMQDRVKAEYIVNNQESIINNSLDFDIESGQEKTQESGKDSQDLFGELMPNGEIFFINDKDVQVFTIPVSVVKEAGKNEWDAENKLIKEKEGRYKLSIILPTQELLGAEFPLTIDPLVVDSTNDANWEGTQFGNSRKLLRDTWGNLIALYRDSLDNTSTQIYYKNYNSTIWTASTTIAEDQADPAGDLDSSGNLHLVFRWNEDIYYNKVNITRSANNTISSIAWEDSSASFRLDNTSGDTAGRPSIIIANKGGGSGVEKVALTYRMNSTSSTVDGNIRFMQCDIADDCTAAANWKNASEEINGSSTCNDSATSGNVGLPTGKTCKGTTDELFIYTGAHTTHHGVLTQMPGKPRRSPGSVKKDLNGTFSDLNNLEDGNSGTTDNINSLTTTDYLYVGDLVKFSKISIDIDTTNSNAQTFSNREYCSSNSDPDTTCDTWSSISNFSDNTATGTTTLLDSGDAGLKGSFLFDEPANWTQSTENGAKEYWTRFRPSGALDSSVSLADVYLNDRNSKALLVLAGIDANDDLGASYVVWDDIGNAGWENRPDNAGNGWRESTTAIDTLGGNWTAFSNSLPLTAAVDYINNAVFVSYVEDQASDVLTVVKTSSNLNPTIAANWTDTGFPTVTEASDIDISLTTDGADIYLFYDLDPGLSGLTFRKCNTFAAPSNGICDTANDWGNERTLVNWEVSVTQPAHVQPIVTKVTSDVIAIDVIYTNRFDGGCGSGCPVEWERHYADLSDKTVAVAASGDDAYHRDCISGTDDQDITATTVKLGREASDGSCAGSVDSENHVGFRFPSIAVGRGVKISSAYVDFRVTTRTGSGSIDFTVYGEDADDSSGFSALTNCTDPCSGAVDERTKTTSSTSQSLDFTTNTYRIDVTDQVQEIICRGATDSAPCVGDFADTTGNWGMGNDLSILLSSAEGGSDNNALITSQDNTNTITVDPTLLINCETSCTASSSATTSSVWCDIGTSGGNGTSDCNDNWESRKKVTFDNRASSENLTNFPVLVRLDSSTIDYAEVKNAGEDLRFVDSDSTTLLDYEIEKWDENGESLVWVEVPSIALGVATDFIWMYYNNGTTTYWDEVIADSPTVLLKMDEVSGNLIDTQAANDGVVSGTALTYRDTGPTGGIPYGATFAAGSIATITDGTDVDLGDGPFSIEMWLKRPTNGVNYSVTKKNTDGVGTDGYEVWWSGSTNAYRLAQGDGTNDLIAETDTDNGWHHYVFTRGTGTDGKIYRDGVEITEFTNGVSFANNNDNLRIGNSFVGSIAGYAIYKSELSQARVTAHYSSSGVGPGQDAQNAWGSYVGAWHLKEDPSTTCAGTDEVCDSTSSNADGNANGTMTSSDQVSGKVDGSLDLDGSDDYVNLGDNASLEVSLPITVSAWVNINSLASHNGIFTNDKNGAANHSGVWINLLSDGTIDASYGNDTGCNSTSRRTKYSATTSTLITTGNWYHVAASIRGATDMTIYINGVDAGGTYEGTGGTITYTANDASIGRIVNCGSGNYMTNGRVDEVRFEDSSLSTDWIEAEYLNTKSDSTFVSIGAEQEFVKQQDAPTNYAQEILGTYGLVGYWRLGEPSGTNANDSSVTGNDGTYTGGYTLGEVGLILGDSNTATSFNGTTGYVTIPDNNAYSLGTTNKLSIAVWVKPDSNPPGGVVIGKGAASNYEWALFYEDTDYYFNMYQSAGGNRALAVTGQYANNEKHFVVATMDEDTDTLLTYVNGEADGSDTSWTGSYTNGTAALNIGRRADPTGYFTGTADEVAIYNRILTPTEIQNLYSKGAGAVESGTRNYSKGFTYASGANSFTDLEHPLSAAEYVAVEGDDNNYAVVSGNLDTSASSSAVPMFQFKVNNPRNSNKSTFNVSAVVKSSVATSTRPIHLQVYRGGSTDDWVTLVSNTSSGADTDIALSSTGIISNFNEYYFNESPGIGTRYSECTDGTANCWAYFRIYQESPGSSVSENLSLDMFEAEFSAYSPPVLRGNTRMRGGTRLR